MAAALNHISWFPAISLRELFKPSTISLSNASPVISCGPPKALWTNLAAFVLLSFRTSAKAAAIAARASGRDSLRRKDQELGAAVKINTHFSEGRHIGADLQARGFAGQEVHHGAGPDGLVLNTCAKNRNQRRRPLRH